MTYVMVRHQVQDYQKWKEGFDADRENLEKAGIQKFGLYRTGDDPKDIVVFMECGSLEQVKEFFGSEHFKERIKANGVVGEPEIVFLDRIEKKILGGAEKAA